jgi:nitrous oxidase accessory protein NosD
VFKRSLLRGHERPAIALLLSSLSILAAAAAAAAAAAGSANAAVSHCSARDGSGPASSNLTAVLAAAKSGDTVHIFGTCTGNFIVTVPLTLAGTVGTTLNGGGSGTVLTVDVPSGTVTINTIEVTGGSAAQGAGIAVDPGTSDPLTLNLLYDQVERNEATSAGAGLDTGAIAALNINYSDFNDNTISAGSHGADGAGIASSAPIDLYESNVIGNTATTAAGQTVTGGAAYLTGPATLFALEVENTTVTGGTILGAGLATTAAATLDESTISGNTATTTSGPITGAGYDATGSSAKIEQTDVLGNTATSGAGAIVGVGIAAGSATPLTLSKVGVDLNKATSTSGPIAGVGIASNAPSTIENTGVYTNQGTSTSGLVQGGGISAEAPLHVSNGLITANTISSTAGSADGGGIWTDANTTISAMTVGGNSAATGGGGIFLLGATLAIKGSQLAGDTAPVGAAIDNVGGSVTESGSLVRGTCLACG